jgi:hypothetical protein
MPPKVTAGDVEEGSGLDEARLRCVLSVVGCW